MHGVREGLDSHSCPKCQKIAKERGFDTSDGETYIFFEEEKAVEPKPTKQLSNK